MGKRFLISLVLVIAVIGLILVGSTVFFSGRYEELVAQQSDAASAEESIDPEDLGELILQNAADDSTREATETPQVATKTPVVSDASETRAKVILQSMTLEEKLCQMLFITPEALTGYTRVTQSGETTRAALTQWPVGGIIYFTTNLVTTEQTTEMLSGIQSFAQDLTVSGLFLGVDEEGGTVARVADSLGTTSFDDMSVYGAAGDTQAVYNIGATQASELTALGFNVNFSPVADVLTNEDNTVVKDRSFGSDPDLVSEMVSQVVSGLTDGGMLCAPKHFPGHGSTGGDTHNGSATSDRTLADLESCDLKPFQAAIEAGAPMIMVGHMTMTEIDPDSPASLSSTIVTGILREELGYDGIIITDAMNMSAITDYYTSGEAAVKAVAAGCDMLLCVSNVSTVISALESAVESGQITQSSIDESVTRILTAKLRYGIIS